MTWSTRQLAEIADTTVNTVRHYHSLGVLDAPQRTFNGYKQYGVPHLMRLIQVRRLVDLGVPLAEIGSPGEDLMLLNGLRRLAAQAGVEIERLHRTRDDIAAILRTSAPVDTPPGFESIASRLSIPDRSLIIIYVKMHDEESVADLTEMVGREPESVRQRFYEVGAHTGELARQRLADQIAQHGVNWRSVACLCEDDSSSHQHRYRDHAQTIAEVLREFYSPAQRDVIVRAALLASESVTPASRLPAA